MELLEKLAYYLSFLFVCLLLVPFLVRSMWIRCLFIFLCGIFLTWLTIFVVNNPAWRWGEIKDQLAISKTFRNDSAYKYIKDNFILIDNASDKAFRPDPEEDPDDSLHTIITDRKKLYSFFSLIDQQSDLIDFVIVDIGFDLTTVYDTALFNSMSRIAKKGKLLLSRSSDSLRNDILRFPDSLYGDIREKTNERLFVSHYTSRNSFVSLPYKAYLKFYNLNAHNTAFANLCIESDQKDIYYCNNPFFPDFQVYDEKLLLNDIRLFDVTDTTIETDFPSDTYFKLGKTINDRYRNDFISALSLRKREDRKNVLLIGAFSSPDEDIHQTLFGRLHGPVIMLNVFYALYAGQHRIALSEVLLLLFVYLLISTLLIYHSLGIPLFRTFKSPFLISYRGRKGGYILLTALEFFAKGILAIFHFVFVEELHYTLLLSLGFIYFLFTGKIINVLSLLFFIGVLEKAIQYSKKSLNLNYEK